MDERHARMPPTPPPRGVLWAKVGPPILLVSLLAVSRFLVLTGTMFVSPEECHTGGIASEVLAHGFQFPLSAYSPEHYENGIIVAGLLAVPFFTVLGANALSLKLLAFLVGCLGAVLGLQLLWRLLDGVDPRSRWAGFAGYALLLGAPPGLFLLKSTDALGDHNEGVMLSMALLVLLFRRQEQPSLQRFVVLWLASGAFMAWQKGTALVVFLAVVNELTQVWRRRQPVRRLLLAPVLATLAYSPAFAIAVSTGLGDWRDVVEKFTPAHLLEPIVTLGRLLWTFGDHSEGWVALFVGALGWLFWKARGAALAPSSARWLAAYAALHVVMVSLSSSEELAVDYVVYLYPVLAASAAWALATAVAVASRYDRRAGLALLASPVVLAFLVFPTHVAWAPDPGLVSRLRADTGHATCTWRFGRAFTRIPGVSPTVALEMCRKLGPGALSLACISGLPDGIWLRSHDALLATDDERLAVAYGRGRQGFHDDREHACSETYTPGGEAWRACRAGLRWECLVYANLASLVVTGESLEAPHCELAPGWPGYFREAGRWSPGDVAPVELTGEIADVLGDRPPCRGVLDECYQRRESL